MRNYERVSCFYLCVAAHVPMYIPHDGTGIPYCLNMMKALHRCNNVPDVTIHSLFHVSSVECVTCNKCIHTGPSFLTGIPFKRHQVSCIPRSSVAAKVFSWLKVGSKSLGKSCF